MKRILKWGLIALVVIFVVLQLIPVDRSNPTVTREVKWDTPETRALAKRACFDCHSNETVWPWDGYIAPASWLMADHVAEGRSRLNFSEWDKPNTDLGEVTESIKEGQMPLSDYLLMHPNAKLTQAESEALVAGLTATMQQDPPIARPRRGGGD
jgi:hypothetical protein